jgi:hypothetical protein
VRVVYEWGINHKMMKVKSYLKGEKGDQLVYESMFLWHPEKKKLMFYSISVAGCRNRRPASAGGGHGRSARSVLVCRQAALPSHETPE